MRSKSRLINILKCLKESGSPDKKMEFSASYMCF